MEESVVNIKIINNLQLSVSTPKFNVTVSMYRVFQHREKRKRNAAQLERTRKYKIYTTLAFDRTHHH